MQAVPIHIKEANAFIAKYHRHSLLTVGGKFAVGTVERGKLVGLAVAGRLVARRLDDGKTIEVLQVCTDGTPNCCSFLYARVVKIARLFGYTRVVTYTLEEESGASLRAVGGRVMGPSPSAGMERPKPPPEKPGCLRKEETAVGALRARRLRSFG